MATSTDTSSCPEWSTFTDFCKGLVKEFHQEVTDSKVKDRLIKQLDDQTTCRGVIQTILENQETSLFLDKKVNAMKQTLGNNDNYKCLQTCKLCLTHGQECFQKKEYNDALFYFSQAVSTAPIDSQEFVTAFIARCNVFFLLNRFNECLKDINVVLNLENFPKERLFLLLIRKILCLKHLDRIKDAEVAANEALTLVRKEFTNNTILASMEDLIQENLHREVTVVDDPEKEVPSIETTLKTHHSNISGASSKVSLARDDVCGRYFVASETIDPSEVVFEENPFGWWMEPKYTSFFCTHCLSSIRGKHFIPCPTCSSCRFCSESCGNQADQEYHSMECKFMPLLQQMSRVHIAIRVILRAGVKNAIQIFLDNEKKSLEKEKKSTNELKHGSNYESTLSLVAPLKNATGFIRLSFALASIIAVRLVFGEWTEFKEENLLTTLSTMTLVHMLQVWLNSVSIEYDELGGTKTLMTSIKSGAVVTGVGLYSTISLLNHCCEKQVYVIFRGKKLSLKSFSGFKSGNEVPFNYGPWDKKLSFKDRQSILQKDFMFNCKCTSCVEKLDNLQECFRCPFCSGEDEGKVIVNYSDNSSQCLSCKVENIYSIEEIESAKNIIRPVLASASSFIREKKHLEAQESLREAITKLGATFHSMSNTMITMKENLANVLEMDKKYQESLTLRKSCLDFLKKQRNGRQDNYFAVYLLRKIAQCMIEDTSSSKEEARVYLQESIDLEKQLQPFEGKRLETPREIMSCLPNAEKLMQTITNDNKECSKEGETQQ